MYVLIIFLLLATCNLSTPIGIYNKENNGLQTKFQSDEWFQSIKDWIDNMKSRIYQRLFGPTTTMIPLPLPIEILNLDKFEIQDRLKNYKWHLLDLSTLSFDPNQDWGFRIDNWYFIRKRFENRNGFEDDSTGWDSSESDVELNTRNDSGVTESSRTASTMMESTIHNTMSTTQQNDLQTIQITEQIESSENFTAGIDEPKSGDNETDNNFVLKGSVEVIMG